MELRQEDILNSHPSELARPRPWPCVGGNEWDLRTCGESIWVNNLRTPDLLSPQPAEVTLSLTLKSSASYPLLADDAENSTSHGICQFRIYLHPPLGHWTNNWG